jgi:hypothetical protein
MGGEYTIFVEDENAHNILGEILGRNESSSSSSLAKRPF